MLVRFTLVRALIVSAVFHAMTLPLAYMSRVRDGGRMFKMALAAAGIYWFSVLWIILKRRGRLAHGELLYLAIGFPLMTIAIYIAGTFI